MNTVNGQVQRCSQISYEITWTKRRLLILFWQDTKENKKQEIQFDLTVHNKKTRGKKIIKFFFDADSSTGGFHRLLLHGLCQFHCLRAASSTTRINGEKARALIATGEFSGGDVRLVDFITERQKKTSNHDDAGSPEAITSKLSALKV